MELSDWLQQLVDGLKRYRANWEPEERDFWKTVQSAIIATDHKQLAAASALALGSYVHLRNDIERYMALDDEARAARSAERAARERMFALLPQHTRRELALKGARAKLAADPKQAAKAEAFKLWQDWQAGKTRHKSGAAFARHVVKAIRVIENTKTVERWVTQWSKHAKAAK
jgi:hypothetical protein